MNKAIELRGAWHRVEVGRWEAFDGTCLVEWRCEMGAPTGEWDWCAMSVDQYISGPYPGTPDWREYIHGEGTEPTMSAAMWKCQRAYQRALVAQDAWEWETTEHFAADPEFPDADWWKATPFEIKQANEEGSK